MIKKLIPLLFLVSTLNAASINTPKFDIYSLENNKNNTFRVRENFKELSANKIDKAYAVDNYSDQTIAGDKTFSGDATFEGAATLNGSVTVNSNPVISSVTVTNTLTAQEVTTTYGFFHDRGDPTISDFTSFTTDGNWHDIDLSSIVPVGTKAVALLVYLQDDAANNLIKFRKNGNTNERNISYVREYVADVVWGFDIVVPVGSDRKIEYAASNTAFTSIEVLVKGWWK